MRFSGASLLLSLLVGCGQKADHPAAAPDCDPATMDCSTYNPPMSSSGSPGGGNEGGAGSDEQVATWSGQVVAYADDYFDMGTVFPGKAEVSAIGVGGARVKGAYDGTSFELKDVLKDPSNWFLVVPAVGAGMLSTITPVDTRTAVMAELKIGLSSEQTVDSIYALSLSGSERSEGRAQIVMRVADPQRRSITGVLAQTTAEIVMYRSGTTWLASDVGTDDSGMLFLANVPASTTLSKVDLTLAGSVSASVEARIMAGATTVVTAIVAGP